MAAPTPFETPFLWTCPYCGRDTTIINVTKSGDVLPGGAFGRLYVTWYGLVCPNPECRKPQFTVQLHRAKEGYGGRWYREDEKFIREWTLIPSSAAKVYPDYIPEQLRHDYEEACLIVQSSPKASATMSRRCLQGMIRDYHRIVRKRLIDEIDALADIVEPDVWQAIDSVRQVGNIGAHMEADVNLVVDVDPEEAGLLIWLIEHLMKQWYINREDRRVKLGEIKALPAAKKALTAPKPQEAPAQDQAE